MAASRLVMAISTRALAGIEPVLTLPQLRTLVVPAEHAPVKPAALAASLGVNPSTAMRTVDRLEVAGLVDRRTDPDARREVTRRLTVPGTRLVERVMTARRAEVVALPARVPPGRRADLAPALRALLEAADDPVPRAGDCRERPVDEIGGGDRRKDPSAPPGSNGRRRTAETELVDERGVPHGVDVRIGDAQAAEPDRDPGPVVVGVRSDSGRGGGEPGEQDGGRQRVDGPVGALGGVAHGGDAKAPPYQYGESDHAGDAGRAAVYQCVRSVEVFADVQFLGPALRYEEPGDVSGGHEQQPVVEQGSVDAQQAALVQLAGACGESETVVVIAPGRARDRQDRHQIGSTAHKAGRDKRVILVGPLAGNVSMAEAEAEGELGTGRASTPVSDRRGSARDLQDSPRPVERVLWGERRPAHLAGRAFSEIGDPACPAGGVIGRVASAISIPTPSPPAMSG
ncbi:hypothetical protein B4N89_41025 [Embleya scabrispora]|uniref:HTH marR-type domain-containing protein n=1 Tax=Embleya scabrispora TaxID=159449 RepID=A0A1T3NJG6_9ACTN|nr:hypothetical protein B4N89_41025 [Embleya scabrispora]